MTDELTPEGREEPDHASLTDDQLVDRLHDHRKGSGEWAAAFSELQRRGDRMHSNARFRDALRQAEDSPPPPADGGGGS